MVLTFSTSLVSVGLTRGNPTHEIATCGMHANFDPDGKVTSGAPIKIQSTKGEIQVCRPMFRPMKYRIILSSIPRAESLWDLPGKGGLQVYSSETRTREKEAWGILGGEWGSRIFEGWKVAEGGLGLGGDYGEYGDDGSSERAKWHYLFRDD